MTIRNRQVLYIICFCFSSLLCQLTLAFDQTNARLWEELLTASSQKSLISKKPVHASQQDWEEKTKVHKDQVSLEQAAAKKGEQTEIINNPPSEDFKTPRKRQR